MSDRTHTYVAWRGVQAPSEPDARNFITRVPHDVREDQAPPFNIPFTPGKMMIIEGVLYVLHGQSETRIARLDLDGNILSDNQILAGRFSRSMAFDGHSLWLAASMNGSDGVLDIFVVQVSLQGEAVGSPIRVTDGSAYVTSGSLTFNGTSFAIGYGSGEGPASQSPHFLSFTVTGTAANVVLPPRQLSRELEGRAFLAGSANGYLARWGIRNRQYARLQLDGQFESFPLTEPRMTSADVARGEDEYVMLLQFSTKSIALLTIPDIGFQGERETFTRGTGPHSAAQIQWDGEGYTTIWNRGDAREDHQVMFARVCLTR